MVDSTKTGRAAQSGGPTVLIRNKYAHDQIAALLQWYAVTYPDEIDAFATHCASLRANAEWTGTFSPVIYNSKEKDWAWEVKIPNRIAFHMTRLFHPDWLDDKVVFDEFCKQWTIGRIKGAPKPDATRHLGKQ